MFNLNPILLRCIAFIWSTPLLQLSRRKFSITATRSATLLLLINIQYHDYDVYIVSIRCTYQTISYVLHQLIDLILIFGVLTPLSAIFQLYHGNQFQWWQKPKYPDRTTDHGQATGKLYHLRSCESSAPFSFCNLPSRARTYAVLMIGLYELLSNPTT